MDDFCISDRHRLATELIAAMSQSELNKLIPPCLKDKSHQAVFDALREQLECMSKERIVALLKGDDYTSAEESEEGESRESTAAIESEEEMEDDDRKSPEEEEEEEEGAVMEGDEGEVESEEEEIELLPLSPEREEKEEKEEGEVTPDYKFSP